MDRIIRTSLGGVSLSKLRPRNEQLIAADGPSLTLAWDKSD